MAEQLKIFDMFKTLNTLNEYVNVSELGDLLGEFGKVMDGEPPLTSPENVKVRLVEVLKLLREGVEVSRTTKDDEFLSAVDSFLDDTGLLDSTAAVLYKFFGVKEVETGGGLVEKISINPEQIAQVMQLIMMLFSMFKK